MLKTSEVMLKALDENIIKLEYEYDTLKINLKKRLKIN